MTAHRLTRALPRCNLSASAVLSAATATTIALILATLVAPAFAADINQEWIISYKTVRPDGVAKLVPVVNGLYPGPTLRGRVGQSVRVVVRNTLPTDTTTIHWHGLKQIATVWSDGTSPSTTPLPFPLLETPHSIRAVTNLNPPFPPPRTPRRPRRHTVPHRPRRDLRL